MAAQTLPLNAYETTDALVLVAPMPAVQPEDVHVRVESGTVRITADCRTEAPKDYLLHEWDYGSYERSFELPDDMGVSGGEASLGNGQLAVRLLKGDPGDTADADIPVSAAGKP